MVTERTNGNRRRFAGVVLLYAVLTLALTFPVAFRLTDALAGYPDGDNTQAMWSSWWFKVALVDLGTWPENVSFLYYPDGYEQPLITATPYTDVSTLPLQMITSPVVAYNLAFLASYLLTAVFTYLFCYHLTGNHWAALVGGFVFAFSPTRTMHAAAGHFSQSTTYWAPLYALFMVRLLEKPTRRDAVLCGVLLALSGLVSLMQTAYFVIPFTLGAVLWGWWQYRKDSGLGLRVRYLTLTAGVALAITSPFYVPFLWQKFFGVWDLLYRPGTVDYSADLLAFFTPSPYHPFFSRLPIQPFLERVVGGFPFEDLVYVGWVPLLLAWYARREKTAALWTGLALVTGILSLGPLLKMGGDLVTYTVENVSTFIPLPYVLVKQLPLYDMGRTPARLTESVMLGMAALTALGLARLLAGRRRGAIKLALAVGTLGLIAFEYLTLWPMPVTAAPVPSFYQQIANDGQDYAILDVPVVNRQVIGDAMYYQTIHRHPIMSGYLWRIPTSGMNLMRFMDSLALASEGPDIGTPEGSLSGGGLGVAAGRPDLVDLIAELARPGPRNRLDPAETDAHRRAEILRQPLADELLCGGKRRAGGHEVHRQMILLVLDDLRLAHPLDGLEHDVEPAECAAVRCIEGVVDTADDLLQPVGIPPAGTDRMFPRQHDRIAEPIPDQDLDLVDESGADRVPGLSSDRGVPPQRLEESELMADMVGPLGALEDAERDLGSAVLIRHPAAERLFHDAALLGGEGLCAGDHGPRPDPLFTDLQRVSRNERCAGGIGVDLLRGDLGDLAHVGVEGGRRDVEVREEPVVLGQIVAPERSAGLVHRHDRTDADRDARLLARDAPEPPLAVLEGPGALVAPLVLVGPERLPGRPAGVPREELSLPRVRDEPQRSFPDLVLFRHGKLLDVGGLRDVAGVESDPGPEFAVVRHVPGGMGQDLLQLRELVRLQALAVPPRGFAQESEHAVVFGAITAPVQYKAVSADHQVLQRKRHPAV